MDADLSSEAPLWRLRGPRLMHQMSDNPVSPSRRRTAEQIGCFPFLFLFFSCQRERDVLTPTADITVARSTATTNTAHKRAASSLSSAAGADNLAFSLHGNRHHYHHLIPTDKKRVVFLHPLTRTDRVIICGTHSN